MCDFLRTWLERQQGQVPSALLHAVKKIWSFAPWLEKAATSSEDVGFLGSYPQGPSLWDQFISRLSRPIKRVIVLGAFFDSELAFIKALHRDLQPGELIIGIDPETVTIPAHAANLTMVRFVDAGFLYKHSGYLHAKALYIDAGDQQKMLITGSANPSAPAWLAHTDARNAEAMIFRSGPEASHLADRLGLKTLGEQPQLSSERWKHISTSSFAIPRPADEPIHSFAIAVETADGFSLPMLDIHLEDIQALHLLNENAARLPFPSQVGRDTTGLAITCGQDLRSSVRYIAVQLKDGRELWALVHHTMMIEHQAHSNRQVQFRAAFTSLRGDKPDLVQLMGIIEKIVFDETRVPNVGPATNGETCKRLTGRRVQRVGVLSRTLGRDSEEKTTALATRGSG